MTELERELLDFFEWLESAREHGHRACRLCHGFLDTARHGNLCKVGIIYNKLRAARDEEKKLEERWKRAVGDLQGKLRDVTTIGFDQWGEELTFYDRYLSAEDEAKAELMLQLRKDGCDHIALLKAMENVS